jgi:plasmid maintenance system killer protein
MELVLRHLAKRPRRPPYLGEIRKPLKGDLAGKHSIRIHDQWRVVFRWTETGPEDVEIIDYHW